MLERGKDPLLKRGVVDVIDCKFAQDDNDPVWLEAKRPRTLGRKTSTKRPSRQASKLQGVVASKRPRRQASRRGALKRPSRQALKLRGVEAFKPPSAEASRRRSVHTVKLRGLEASNLNRLPAHDAHLAQPVIRSILIDRFCSHIQHMYINTQ